MTATERLRIEQREDGKIVCWLNLDDHDPAEWGIMLVDAARHVADAYWKNYGRDPAKVLARITEIAVKELMKPTSGRSDITDD